MAHRSQEERLDVLPTRQVEAGRSHTQDTLCSPINLRPLGRLDGVRPWRHLPAHAMQYIG